MKIKNNIINNTQTIIEQPIFKSPSKWLKYINLVLGEQILETIPGQLTFSIFQKDENIQTSNLFYKIGK